MIGSTVVIAILAIMFGAHIAKKALCSGQRGHKDLLTEIQDIIDTAERWKEMLIEDEKGK